MELKLYLRIITKRWWIVLPAFLITFAATLAFTFAQTPLYQAKATFIVNLEASFTDDKDFTSALDILSRRVEIATTYTEVAKSRLIKTQAFEELNLSPDQKRDISVESRLVGGTNVLEITVQAPDPILARDFANAVGAKTVSYVRSIYKTYGLEALDQAVAPGSPVKPTVALNLTLGAIMGVVLGIGLAFLSEYLRTPIATATNFGILDDETGAYNRQYFGLRLQQEMSRARRHAHHLSVALMNIDRLGMFDAAPQQLRRAALQSVKSLLQPYLRDEDIMARFDQTVFAFLLPDMTGKAAKTAIEKMQMAIAAIPLDRDHNDSQFVLHSSAAVVTYPSADLDEGAGSDDLLDRAAHALKHAENTTYGKVNLSSKLEKPPGAAGTRRPARSAAVNGKLRQDSQFSESPSKERILIMRRRR